MHKLNDICIWYNFYITAVKYNTNVYFTLYNVHYTQYNVHYTVYIEHFTVYNINNGVNGNIFITNIMYYSYLYWIGLF